jgi:hypothetical protein
MKFKDMNKFILKTKMNFWNPIPTNWNFKNFINYNSYRSFKDGIYVFYKLYKPFDRDVYIIINEMTEHYLCMDCIKKENDRSVNNYRMLKYNDINGSHSTLYYTSNRKEFIELLKEDQIDLYKLLGWKKPYMCDEAPYIIYI